MTAPCGATVHDVHGNAVCDLDAGHCGGHSGEVMAGVRLSWAAAPPLSPREREIVDRFENATPPFMPHVERFDRGWRVHCGLCLWHSRDLPFPDPDSALHCHALHKVLCKGGA